MTDRNPLIENNPEDTLLNVHLVLTFLQEFHTNNQFDDIPKAQINHIGLSLILKCANEALNYEIERLEKPSGRTTVFKPSYFSRQVQLLGLSP